MYAPSETLLGVWVTRPLYRKVRVWNGEKYVSEYQCTDHEVMCIGVVPIDVQPGSWGSTDPRHKILGVPGAESVVVKIAPIMIGWTNDAGKTFKTDQDMINKHGLKTFMEILKEYPVREAPQWH